MKDNIRNYSTREKKSNKTGVVPGLYDNTGNLSQDSEKEVDYTWTREVFQIINDYRLHKNDIFSEMILERLYFN